MHMSGNENAWRKVKERREMHRGSSGHDIPVRSNAASSDHDKVIQGKLCELEGEDFDAEKLYELAGSAGQVDRVRIMLKRGCVSTDVSKLCTSSGLSEACAYLARFLNQSEDLCEKAKLDIVTLYCHGNCVDFAVHFALERKFELMNHLLQLLTTPSTFSFSARQVKHLTSWLQSQGRVEDAADILTKSRDGVCAAMDIYLDHQMSQQRGSIILRRIPDKQVRAYLQNHEKRNRLVELLHERLELNALVKVYLLFPAEYEARIFELYVHFP
jgi:hypothetical protein